MADEVIEQKPDAALAGEAPVTAPEGNAPAPETKPETLLSDAGGEDKSIAAPADWPEDWRKRMVGDDEKALKAAERFKSVQDLWKAHEEAQKKIRSGDIKPVLPKDATPEQVAEYRKANGIPDSADGYLEKLPNGLVIGDDDKPIVQSFLDKVHGKNASPEIVTEALAWYYDAQEQAAAELVKADRESRTAAADELRAEWGNEYRANFNAAMSFLETAPDGVKDEILKGRGASGVALGDNPAVLRWLVHLANEANPAGFVSPSAGANQIDHVEARIKEIESKMGTPEYTKDEAVQAELRKLYAAQSKLKTRAA